MPCCAGSGPRKRVKGMVPSSLGDGVDVEDGAAGIEVVLLLLARSPDGVLGGEDVVELLEGAVLGLGNEEVEDAGLDEAPNTEDDVRHPADVLEGDGDTELVGHEGCASQYDEMNGGMGRKSTHRSS